MSSQRFEACQNCRWWQRWVESRHGQCHRHAPQLCYGSLKKFDYEPCDALAAVFPVTHENEWCGEFESQPAPSLQAMTPELSAKSVRDLTLPTMTFNALYYGPCDDRIQTVGELCDHTAEDLLDRRQFGVKSLQRVRDALAKLGLKLKYD